MDNATAVIVGLHHAIRARTNQRHRTIMCDTIETAPDPQLVLDEVIRRLGRHRAMNVEIPAHHIRAALRRPKEFRPRED